MGFELPWMLWGLVAATIPIAIHLMQRRQARVLPFAAVEFLLLGNAKRARRLRLRQWLVLAARVGLLAALALALAKPYISLESAPGVASGEPSAVVLLLDDSASMNARGAEGERLFEAMIEAARERIDSGGPLARFGLVAMGRPARRLTPALTSDRGALERSLGELLPSDRGADTAVALDHARELLDSAVDEARVVWIGTDRALHAWEGISAKGLGEAQARSRPFVEIPALPVEARPRNLSILAVRPTAGAGPSGETAFEVEVFNHSEWDETVEVRIRVGEEAAAVSLAVPARSAKSAEVHLALATNVGSRRASAEIHSSEDALASDDILYFQLGATRALRVAVVNGSPRSVPWLDEVFFLKAGLLARGQGGERWSAEHLRQGDLTSGVLVHTDVVILANVGALSSAQALALRHYVKGGGGLLIALGDQMSAESNRSYGSLLPLPIRSIRRMGTDREPGAGDGLEIIDRDHPILRPFVGEESTTLTRTRVRIMALLAQGNVDQVSTLARWAGGAPALVEAPMGQGRIVMLTTSLDRDGSDLVLRTSFVPFLQRTVAYLAGRYDEERTGEPQIGRLVTLEAPPGAGDLVLTGPEGLERIIDEGLACTGRPARCDLGILERAGSYALARASDPTLRKGLSLNVDREEGDLETYTADGLRGHLQGDATEPVMAEAVSRAGPPPRPVGGQPLWPAALVALFGLLLAEAWFACRRI
jgi:hypothetical protein